MITTNATATVDLGSDDLDRPHVPAMHDVRLTWACGHFSMLPLPGSGTDQERPWVCPICAMDDADLDRELARIAASRREDRQAPPRRARR